MGSKQGVAMASKLRSNVPVGTVAKRGTKKGTSTPKTKTPRSTGRYVEAKIRIPILDFLKGLSDG
jgi:hypothetical protein